MPRESGSPDHAASRRPGDDSENEQRGFFGRRKGHPLRPHQVTLHATLLPKLALDLSKPAPGDLRTLFPAAAEVRLEIGFGGGEHLVAQARNNPRVGYIGVEPFLNGMAKALAAIEHHQLTNIRLSAGDALRLLGWLPPESLSRIDLLYPDPWPKRRHWKRRFIQHETLARLARLLKPNAELRFATDIDDYAVWTLARSQRSADLEWTAQTADDWRKPWADFAGTRYEAKAKAAGRLPCYLSFRRR